MNNTQVIMFSVLRSVLTFYAVLLIINQVVGGHSLAYTDNDQMVRPNKFEIPNGNRIMKYIEEGTLYGEFLPTGNGHKKLKRRNKRDVMLDRKVSDFPGDFTIKVKVPAMVEEEVPYRVFLDNTQTLRKMEQKSMYRDLLNKYLHDPEIPRHYAPFYSHVKFPNHSPVHMPLNPLGMQSTHFNNPHATDLLHLSEHNVQYPVDPMLHYGSFYDKYYPTIYDKYLYYKPDYMRPESSGLLSHAHGLYNGHRKYGLWNMQPFNYHTRLQPSYDMPNPDLWPDVQPSPEYLYHLYSEEKQPFNYAGLKFLEDHDKEILHDLNAKRIRDSLLQSAFRDQQRIYVIDGAKLHDKFVPQYDDIAAKGGPMLYHSKHTTDSNFPKSLGEHHIAQESQDSDPKPKFMDYQPTKIHYPQTIHKEISANRYHDHQYSSENKEVSDSATAHDLKAQQNRQHNYRISQSVPKTIYPTEQETRSETKYITVRTANENQGTQGKVDVHYGGYDRRNPADTFNDNTAKYDTVYHNIQKNRNVNLHGTSEEEIALHKHDEVSGTIRDSHRIPEQNKQGSIIREESYSNRYPASSSQATKVTEITETKRILVPMDNKQHINLAIQHDRIPQHNKYIESQMVRNDGLQQTSTTNTQLNKHKITQMKVVSRHSPEIKNIIHVSVAEQEVKPGGMIEESKIDNLDRNRTIQVTENPEEQDNLGVQTFPDLNKTMKDGFQETVHKTYNERPITNIKHTTSIAN